MTEFSGTHTTMQESLLLPLVWTCIFLLLQEGDVGVQFGQQGASSNQKIEPSVCFCYVRFALNPMFFWYFLGN